MNRGGRSPRKGGVRACLASPQTFVAAIFSVRAAREEGLCFDRIEVAKDGGFTIHASNSTTSRTPSSSDGSERPRN